MRKLNLNSKKIYLALTASIVVIFGAVLYVNRPTDTTKNTPTMVADTKVVESEVALEPEVKDTSAVQANNMAQEELLLYLIEEEKLAYDVYSNLYEQYGARVFGNILKSEATHQSRVLSVLEAHNIADPRSSEVGVFNNQDLQELYDSLMAQGMKSAEEAYKVGVAIEEKDIADITNQLATATDSDIVQTLEDLRNGSENHLRAFNRQLSKY